MEGAPVLECRFEAIDLGFEHPHEVENRTFTYPDLEGAIGGTSGDVPMTALQDLGGFQFEAYWFNRQRLTRIDSIGDQKVVRDLQKRWSGILLFRDNFRVLPYGEDDDDWLAMDRRALASTGYLLNKTQFVGRVAISRLGNSKLVDQTNREGLRVCPEQQAFISLLQLAFQSQLREFLKDVERRHKNQPIDMKGARTEVETLEKRAKTAINHIRKVTPESLPLLNELQHAFAEIKELYDRAEQRVVEVENENRQMLQMAGVGLLVEVVAHELARATENALAALEALRGRALPQQTAALLDSLRSEMTAVSKRVRVLDPLSVSGRQRKEVFDFSGLIREVLSSHEAQFRRHEIELKLKLPSTRVRVKAVKGMMVQIIENLLSNSVYWLELRKEHERDFEPCITITLAADPLRMTYEDNGRGIAVENKEKVFRAFFSLKEKSKRRGLGLYIARDCAEYHRGELFVDDQVSKDTGRLHRFVLLLPDEVKVP
ncbi:MAG: HAMP domain-containing sensor histidine kinase [Burkholderiaceae bacterium]